MRNGKFCGDRDTEIIHQHHLFEILDIALFRAHGAGAQTGIGQHHIQPPEPVGGRGKHHLLLIRIGDIAGHRQGVLLAQFSDKSFQLVGRPCRQNDCVPGLRRMARTGLSDARRCASDEDDFAHDMSF